MNLGPLTIVIYVAIAALVFYRVVYRQLRGTHLTRKRLVTLPFILTAVGVFSALGVLRTASGTELALLSADVVLLAGLGVLRSASSTLTERDGTAFVKGSPATLLLWLTTIGVRVGFGFLGAALGVSNAATSSSIMLTLGISIGVQNAFTYYRIQRRGLPLADQVRVGAS
ncbi:hypothetical protein [Amycolatopsis jejuensis]|uniref:hypothetical protein n=1 Tax=Amycolatopsis jejuensis TaxID=330084 RepID=UPI000527A463|nr:hypothetical protein [Amycolatopsis jejuensis]